MQAPRRKPAPQSLHARDAAALADLYKELESYYSDIGRPSVDPELMIRTLIVG